MNKWAEKVNKQEVIVRCVLPGYNMHDVEKRKCKSHCRVDLVTHAGDIDLPGNIRTRVQ